MEWCDDVDADDASCWSMFGLAECSSISGSSLKMTEDILGHTTTDSPSFAHMKLGILCCKCKYRRYWSPSRDSHSSDIICRVSNFAPCQETICKQSTSVCISPITITSSYEEDMSIVYSFGSFLAVHHNLLVSWYVHICQVNNLWMTQWFVMC